MLDDIAGPADAFRERKVQLALAIKQRRLREEAAFYQERLIDFFRAAWPAVKPDRYAHNWHLDAISEHLEAVAYGQIKKLCINLPPRHTKTMLVSICWPAWMWALEPDERFPLIGPGGTFLCLSYSDPLAMDNATAARRLITSPWYQDRWGASSALKRVLLARDQGGKERFDTMAGGSRISGSFKGTVTGRGGGIRVYDDPHKMDEVESDVVRKDVLQTYETSLMSRFTDPGTSAEVLVAQRGHMDDLSKRFIDTGDVVHLNLPAEYNSAMHCVTKLGVDEDGNDILWEDPRVQDKQLLWPGRFTAQILAPFKKKSYEWASQWQQSPITRGGGIIKEKYWQIHEVRKKIDPSTKRFVGWKFVPDMIPLFVLGSLDTAYGEKEEDSYNALTIWAVYIYKGQTRCILLDGWQKKLDFHGDAPPQKDGETDAAYFHRTSDKWGLVEWVIYTCKKRKVTRLLIENKTRGKDVNKELRRVFGARNFGIVLIDPKTDKWSRAHSVVDLFTDEMIFAPAEIEETTGQVLWLDYATEIIDEIAAFPHGTHDDLVDTCTMALKYLRDNGLLLRRDEQSIIDRAKAMHKPAKREAIYPV